MSEEFVILLGEEDQGEQAKSTNPSKVSDVKKSDEFVILLDSEESGAKSDSAAKPEEFVVLLDEPAPAESASKDTKGGAAKEFVVLLDEKTSNGAVWKYKLPSSTTIGEIRDLYADLAKVPWTEVSEIVMDASEVSGVDTPTLQALVYFAQYAIEREVRVEFSGCSEVFRSTCKQLDFSQFLDLAA